MLIIPAIDLRGGKCVRLRQGDYAQETVFSDDPAAMAQHWVNQGARYLHLVDLDGAKAGRPINEAAIRAIVTAAGVPCELGGGLRDEDHLRLAFRLGVERLIIGTQALKNPSWFESMCRLFPGKLLLGLDAKDGRVATEGWLDVSTVKSVELAKQFEGWPLAGLVYTDIARDGMLQGPNFAGLEEMTEAVHVPVIASGGVTTIDDIKRLATMPLAGCIVGRAIYEGTLNLAEAIQTVMGDE